MSSNDPQSIALTHFEQGRQLVDQNKPIQALLKLKQVIEIIPSHGCAYHLMGKSHQQLGNQQDAESCQLRSCQLDPAIGWNWYALGELQQHRGALQEGIEALTMASKWLPTERWIMDRVRQVKRQLSWEEFRYQEDAKLRFGTNVLINGVWALRPDVRRILEGEIERLPLWLILDGPKDYLAAIVFREELMQSLQPWANQPAALETTNTLPIKTLSAPISRLMLEIWKQQKPLQYRFNINTLSGQLGLFWWFVLEGTANYGLEKLWTDSLQQYLNQPVDRNKPAITQLMSAGQRQLGRMDVSDQDLAGWWQKQGLSGQVVEFELALKNHNNDDQKSIQPEVTQVASPTAPSLPFGVNLIGFARGVLGIGEDIRMAAKALEAAAIPYSVYEVHTDQSIDSNENSLHFELSELMPYQANLFCLTGIETLRVGLTDYLPMMLRRYTNIGYWPWEFERWPLVFQGSYELVDEIWASTQFTAEAYKADGRVNVECMPMHVDVSPSEGLRRKTFNLPTEAYLFLFTFDVSSSIHRKNPLAILRAFQAAFPKDDYSVGLVVKLMRGSASYAHALLELRAAAKMDKRIIVIETTLPRAQLLDLIRACDAYISLHRCEGFGRGMAEAMLLGKPVIATKYSGNLDFCTPKSALLVDAELIPVMHDEYEHALGQCWAQPNQYSAISALQQAADGWKPDIKSIKEIEQRYSAKEVGNNYRKRLEVIQQTQRTKSNKSA